MNPMTAVKAIVASVLSLSLCITGVYATWVYSEGAALPDSDIIDVSMGEITFGPPEILHISAAGLHATQNAHNINVSFTHPTYLSTAVNGSRTYSTVTYKVTLWNNTPMTYWYLGAQWNDASLNNALIGNGLTIITKDVDTDTSMTFNTQDWIPPYTTRDIYVTYQIDAAVVNQDLLTLINLRFGKKVGAVHDKFLAILNDKESENGYYYLAEYFDQRYKEDGSMAVANLGEDKAFFDRLFGGDLMINMDGEDVPVTVMIRRENMDARTTGDAYNNGPSGCEYVLYITVNAEDSPTGKAITYIMGYSTGGVGAPYGTWYHLGQMYEGTASPELYRDSGEYAVDYENWVASKKDYSFIDGWTYKVGYEQGDQYDKYTTAEQLMSAADQDVFNDIDNSRFLQTIWKVVNNKNNYNKPGYELLRAAFENAAPFYNVYNGGQEVKVKRNSTRSEIIPYMIAIQDAYNYYLEVNP